MVAIKGMEMPNACTSTQETLGDIEVANCPLYNVCKHRDTIRTNYKPADCPLIEIVTCKDCKHRIGCKCENLNLIVGDNGYCSNGERKK